MTVTGSLLHCFICLQLFILCYGGSESSRELPAILCPDGFLRLDSRCFKPVKSTKTWIESYRYCQDAFRGNLAVVDVPDVFNGLTLFMRKNNMEFAWVGARDVHGHGRLQWVNGQYCCHSWWVPGEPNGGAGQCVQLWKHETHIGFDDTGCDARRPGFICEAKGCQMMNIQNCQKYRCSSKSVLSCIQCKTGFHGIENGSLCFDIGSPLHIKCFQSCIVIFTETQTWNNAKDICNARNGHLYVPEVPDEDYSFRTYLEAIISTDKMFWVGGKLLQTKQTQWIDNLPVQFERWSTKPETMNEDLCIAIDPRDEYRLKAVSCAESLFFICHESSPFNILAVG